MFHTYFVGMLVICLRTKRQILGTNGSLVTAVKLKTKLKFSHGHHVVVLHSTKNVLTTVA